MSAGLFCSVSKKSDDFDEGSQIGTCDRIDITTIYFNFPDRGLAGDAPITNWLRPSLPFSCAMASSFIVVYYDGSYLL